MPMFMRGAIPTPRHKLLAASPHVITRTAPLQFGVVVPKLSMWGNSQYGDCVSAEEAWAKAVYAVMCGLPETFITEATVIAWAKQHGVLNGADLSQVMDQMAKTGMTADDGKTYIDGGYTGVDYSNETALQNAIASGPVKLGIDANALPSGAGNSNGWFALGGKQQYRNEDHCVGTSAFGPASFIFQQCFNMPVPAGVAPDTPGYDLFSWSTRGFVTHDWIMDTVGEAWERTPTTPGQTPAPVSPLDWLL